MEQYDLDTQCMLKYFGPIITVFSFVFVYDGRIAYRVDPDLVEQSDLGLHSLIWVCTVCLCSIPIFRLQEYLVTFR